MEELRRCTSHPTAADLYEIVRVRLPKISLGTVYRNLELLAKSGDVRKLDSGGNGARFDPEMHRHHHIRCLECGRVDDVTARTSGDAGTMADKLDGWQVFEQRVEFVGTCPDCLSKKSQTSGIDKQE